MRDAPDLLSSGRSIGELIWIESRLFEVTGRWIATTPEPRARVFLAAASGHHGWHAELLSTLLPLVTGGPTAEQLVVPMARHAGLVAELDSITPTVERMRLAWGTIVPSVASAAEAHIAASSAVAEAAGHRLLRIVIADELADIETAGRVVDELGGTSSRER